MFIGVTWRRLRADDKKQTPVGILLAIGSVGDLTERGSLAELEAVRDWFRALPHQHKLFATLIQACFARMYLRITVLSRDCLQQRDCDLPKTNPGRDIFGRDIFITSSAMAVVQSAPHHSSLDW